MLRHFYNGLSIVRFGLVWPSSVVQRTHSTWNSFVHPRVFLYAHEILRLRARSHLAIACTIVRTIFSGGPGFKPLALQHNLFAGPGFEPLPVQHDLFVGPGFDSLALIARV